MTTTIIMTGDRPAGMRVRRLRLEREGAEPRELAQRRITIGSHASNDVVIEDAAVSRFHCRIAADERGFRIIDADSANGTFLNGTRIRDAYLADGARIDVGATGLVVRLLDDEADIELSEHDGFGFAVGRSVAMREVFAVAQRAAATPATVLITGETGTGKDVLARSIHAMSPVAQGPFEVFDCGAVSPTLIEAALFGHVRGAFTGAETDRPGVFERAHGGTLFLDEIGELPLDLQPKLLRALDSRNVQRVGGAHQIPVEVRLIAATNRDIAGMIERGQFRDDLFYRLAVVPIELPPLRERPEDIPLLAAHFVRDLLARDGRDPAWLMPHLDEAFGALKGYAWPGNVRELRNAVERAATLADPAELAKTGLATLVELRTSLARTKGALLPLEQSRAEHDREYLRDVLERAGGDIKRAAAMADIHPKSLERLLRKYQVPRR